MERRGHMQKILVTSKLITKYIDHLAMQEKSAATMQKYYHDLVSFMAFTEGAPVTKSMLIKWKSQIAECRAPSTVNSMIAAVNGLMTYIDRRDLTVKPLKIQKTLFLDERKELSRADYNRLVVAAERKSERMSLIMQTICATGIRVSELKFITVEAVKQSRAEIRNKGKLRVIFLPGKLCQLLRKYIKRHKKTVGVVFTTRTGKPLDRSNIWREMKKLCSDANVSPCKVFPHNLRHLFARTYYAIQKDMTKLADILGHSNINTTRIYTAESGRTHALQLEQLGLVVT